MSCVYVRGCSAWKGVYARAACVYEFLRQFARSPSICSAEHIAHDYMISCIALSVCGCEGRSTDEREGVSVERGHA